jgi:haloalkane dehalogenase
MERLRTPLERFGNLVDFPYEPRMIELTDPTGGPALAMALVDEGPRDAAETFLLLHGEPTWSYLYRKMIPGLVAAGHRVIAPDLIGFGRSDKPTRREDYTYARHVEWVREALLDVLNLDQLTFFGQDWAPSWAYGWLPKTVSGSRAWLSATEVCPPGPVERRKPS